MGDMVHKMEADGVIFFQCKYTSTEMNTILLSHVLNGKQSQHQITAAQNFSSATRQQLTSLCTTWRLIKNIPFHHSGFILLNQHQTLFLILPSVSLKRNCNKYKRAFHFQS